MDDKLSVQWNESTSHVTESYKDSGDEGIYLFWRNYLLGSAILIGPISFAFYVKLTI